MARDITKVDDTDVVMYRLIKRDGEGRPEAFGPYTTLGAAKAIVTSALNSRDRWRRYGATPGPPIEFTIEEGLLSWSGKIVKKYDDHGEIDLNE